MLDKSGKVETINDLLFAQFYNAHGKQESCIDDSIRGKIGWSVNYILDQK
jgi:hypothetical protein